jgi:hypothetical protein
MAIFPNADSATKVVPGMESQAWQSVAVAQPIAEEDHKNRVHPR